MGTRFLSVLCHWFVVGWVFVMISVLLFLYLCFFGEIACLFCQHTRVQLCYDLAPELQILGA